MIVIKLGGTSVSRVEFIEQITNKIINENKPVIVVLSALSQTTNLLEELKSATCNEKRNHIIEKIYMIHIEYINKLFVDLKSINIAKRLLRKIIYKLNKALNNGEIQLLPAFGEYLSTSLYSLYLKSIDVKHILRNSTQFIKLNYKREPDIDFIKNACNIAWTDINIFQGFVCLDDKDNITTLSRGGSDFTATLLAEAVKANKIEIWTDIDGIRSNDPRFVDQTNCVSQLNYKEAAELAYFGAKILHPESVLPAQRSDIPIILKNSKNISHKGTCINNVEEELQIKAIAAKDDVILINITSYRMLMAYGFLSKIFDVFSKYKTAIDLITTSEVSVSLTIDNAKFLNKIVAELNAFSEVTIKKNMSIISVVGNFGKARKSIAAEIINKISNPIEIMSYGTNRRNISVLVEHKYKSKNLNELNELSLI